MLQKGQELLSGTYVALGWVLLGKAEFLKSSCFYSRNHCPKLPMALILLRLISNVSLADKLWVPTSAIPVRKYGPLPGC